MKESLAACFLITSTFFALLSTEGYSFTLYTIVVQSQKHRICKTLHEELQTLLHASKAQIGLLSSQTLNIRIMHLSYMF